MSRIGKLPIKVPTNVKIYYDNSNLKVSGPFGELNRNIPHSLLIQQKDETLIISPKLEAQPVQSLHGLYRSLINNMVIGVSKNFNLTLILQGVGYRATVKDENSLILNLGYSHRIELLIPQNISITVVKNTSITLISSNKQDLGFFAAKIRSYRLPEPYKGKGIRYEGEIIKRKAGKSGKK